MNFFAHKCLKVFATDVCCHPAHLGHHILSIVESLHSHHEDSVVIKCLIGQYRTLWSIVMVKFCSVDEVNSPTRIAMVQGPPEQVQRATQMINEIVEQVMVIRFLFICF